MKSIDVPNLSTPIWPSALTRVAAQRDRARNVAIRLEQENAHLLDLISNIASDLMMMQREQAIEIDHWPAAEALLDMIEQAQQ
jgi:hypothetical protein